MISTKNLSAIKHTAVILTANAYLSVMSLLQILYFGYCDLAVVKLAIEHSSVRNIDARTTLSGPLDATVQLVLRILRPNNNLYLISQPH